MEIFFIFLMGLAIGSFLNVVVKRLPRNGVLERRRSFCFHCNTTLSWTENIPIISYLVQKGLCKSCKMPIGVEYLLGEVLFALLLAGLFVKFGLTAPFALFGITFALLHILFWYDALYQLVPDLVAGLAAVMLLIAQWSVGADWRSLAWGAVIGGGFFAAQYLLSRGRWIGWGDVYLGVLCGLLVGAASTVVALFAAYLIGAGYAVYALARKRVQRGAMIAFGPFIIAGAYISFFWGAELMAWYLSLSL